MRANYFIGRALIEICLMIKIENIFHCFNSQNKDFLIHDFSLKIKPRECYLFTGPSGSGKSTLAKIIAGHLRPTAGSINLNKMNITAKCRREILLIHQESDLFPWLNSLQQIEIAQSQKNKDSAIELLRLVKLEKFSLLYPNQLSGGMAKRLCLARALAARPDLLIIDEGFHSLGRELRTELIADIYQIWQQNQFSLIFITHDTEDFSVFSNAQKIYFPLQSKVNL